MPANLGLALVLVEMRPIPTAITSNCLKFPITARIRRQSGDSWLMRLAIYGTLISTWYLPPSISMDYGMLWKMDVPRKRLYGIFPALRKLWTRLLITSSALAKWILSMSMNILQAFFQHTSFIGFVLNGVSRTC